MIEMISAFYQNKLSSLNVDRSSGHPKPHKVCLLLAIMELIKDGIVNKNGFVIDDKLKSAFHIQFQKLKKANDSENITLPFYHLQSDGIWHFKVKSGKEREFTELKENYITPSPKSLFAVIDHAYLDKELYGYFQNELSRNVAKQALLVNLEDLSVQFHRWLLSVGKSERTATSYVGAIKGTISDWASAASITNRNLISILSYSTIHSIAVRLGNYDVYIEKNKTGNQMYSAALNSYEKFLAFTCQADVNEDIEEIINDKALDNTQKSILVNARVGQGKFREDLIKYWKGCAVTGYKSTQFLVASHIKPWRASNDKERLDKYNGILLLPNLDKAFDLGYISFSESGDIIASEFIEFPKMLGIRDNMKINLERQHQEYLAYHRRDVFEKHSR